jgi:hypothetical protein
MMASFNANLASNFSRRRLNETRHDNTVTNIRNANPACEPIVMVFVLGYMPVCVILPSQIKSMYNLVIFNQIFGGSYILWTHQYTPSFDRYLNSTCYYFVVVVLLVVAHSRIPILSSFDTFSTFS